MIKKFPKLPIERGKVVTTTEMRRIEELSLQEKASTDEEYMDRAALGIVPIVMHMIHQKDLDSTITLLVGKGNNGGDAYAVGIDLLDRGFDVVAYQLFPKNECSLLNQKKQERFVKDGGKVYRVSKKEDIIFKERELVIDGLLGSGFRGTIEGLMKEVIDRLNDSYAKVLSIDIASGVDGDTGIVRGSAVVANVTSYLGLTRVGHLFNQGFECAGDLIQVDFGLSAKYLDQAKAFGYLVNPESIKYNLPRHERCANKYTVGQALVIGGSYEMPGAALISSYAALRSGAGMVRLFYPSSMKTAISHQVLEIIREEFDITKMDRLKEELVRTKAILIGPGLGRKKEVPILLEALYQYIHLPLVIDGDALFFLTDTSPSNAVLTPHRGELVRLLQLSKETSDIELIDKAYAYAKRNHVVIVFKGAPTIVIAPDKDHVIIPYGNKGMATAGTGDVLAGIIVSFLAQGASLRDAAILGALVHALAGDKAKEIKSERGMIASDIIEALPHILL